MTAESAHIPNLPNPIDVANAPAIEAKVPTPSEKASINRNGWAKQIGVQLFSGKKIEDLDLAQVKENITKGVEPDNLEDRKPRPDNLSKFGTLSQIDASNLSPEKKEQLKQAKIEVATRLQAQALGKAILNGTEFTQTEIETFKEMGKRGILPIAGGDAEGVDKVFDSNFGGKNLNAPDFISVVRILRRRDEVQEGLTEASNRMEDIADRIGIGTSKTTPEQEEDYRRLDEFIQRRTEELKLENVVATAETMGAVLSGRVTDTMRKQRSLGGISLIPEAGTPAGDTLPPRPRTKRERELYPGLSEYYDWADKFDNAAEEEKRMIFRETFLEAKEQMKKAEGTTGLGSLLQDWGSSPFKIYKLIGETITGKSKLSEEFAEEILDSWSNLYGRLGIQQAKTWDAASDAVKHIEGDVFNTAYRKVALDQEHREGGSKVTVAHAVHTLKEVFVYTPDTHVFIGDVREVLAQGKNKFRRQHGEIGLVDNHGDPIMGATEEADIRARGGEVGRVSLNSNKNINARFLAEWAEDILWVCGEISETGQKDSPPNFHAEKVQNSYRQLNEANGGAGFTARHRFDIYPTPIMGFIGTTLSKQVIRINNNEFDGRTYNRLVRNAQKKRDRRETLNDKERRYLDLGYVARDQQINNSNIDLEDQPPMKLGEAVRYQFDANRLIAIDWNDDALRIFDRSNPKGYKGNTDRISNVAAFWNDAYKKAGQGIMEGKGKRPPIQIYGGDTEPGMEAFKEAFESNAFLQHLNSSGRSKMAKYFLTYDLLFNMAPNQEEWEILNEEVHEKHEKAGKGPNQVAWWDKGSSIHFIEDYYHIAPRAHTVKLANPLKPEIRKNRIEKYSGMMATEDIWDLYERFVDPDLRQDQAERFAGSIVKVIGGTVGEMMKALSKAKI